MEDQRLAEKKAIVEAFKAGKVRLELSSLLNEYFRKYLCVKNLGENEKKETRSPYDEMMEPLLHEGNINITTKS